MKARNFRSVFSLFAALALLSAIFCGCSGGEMLPRVRNYSGIWKSTSSTFEMYMVINEDGTCSEIMRLDGGIFPAISQSDAPSASGDAAQSGARYIGFGGTHTDGYKGLEMTFDILGEQVTEYIEADAFFGTNPVCFRTGMTVAPDFITIEDYIDEAARQIAAIREQAGHIYSEEELTELKQEIKEEIIGFYKDR